MPKPPAAFSPLTTTKSSWWSAIRPGSRSIDRGPAGAPDEVTEEENSHEHRSRFRRVRGEIERLRLGHDPVEPDVVRLGRDRRHFLHGKGEADKRRPMAPLPRGGDRRGRRGRGRSRGARRSGRRPTTGRDHEVGIDDSARSGAGASVPKPPATSGSPGPVAAKDHRRRHRPSTGSATSDAPRRAAPVDDRRGSTSLRIATIGRDDCRADRLRRWRSPAPPMRARCRARGRRRRARRGAPAPPARSAALVGRCDRRQASGSADRRKHQERGRDGRWRDRSRRPTT